MTRDSDGVAGGAPAARPGGTSCMAHGRGPAAAVAPLSMEDKAADVLAAAARAAARGERDLGAIDAARVLATRPQPGPGRAAALHLLGVVLLQRDRFDLAARFLEHAARADPTNNAYGAHLRLVRREARDHAGPPGLAPSEQHPVMQPGYISLESLSACRKLVDLRGRRVLQVGGARLSSHEVPADVAGWAWVDATPAIQSGPAVTGGPEGRGDTEPTRGPGRSHDKIPGSSREDGPREGIAGEVAPIQPESFDLVFSCGVLEHAHDFPGTLDHLARVLRPGGVLFAEVRPLWSSAAGHHVSLARSGTKGREGCAEGVLPRWCHLLWEERDMRAYLTPLLDEEEARRVAEQVFRGSFLNRLFEDDVLAILNSSTLLIERLEALLSDPCSAFLTERLRTVWPGHERFGARGLRLVMRKPL